MHSTDQTALTTALREARDFIANVHPASQHDAIARWDALLADPGLAWCERGVMDEAAERTEFLNAVHRLARYWLGEDGSNVPEHYSTAHRIDGFTHSLLAEIDGCGNGFYRLLAVENNDDGDVDVAARDIAGGLHELMKRVDK